MRQTNRAIKINLNRHRKGLFFAVVGRVREAEDQMNFTINSGDAPMKVIRADCAYGQDVALFHAPKIKRLATDENDIALP